MRLNRSMWRAFLAVILVVMPLTAIVVVPAVGAADPALWTQTQAPDGKVWFSNDYAELLASGFDEIIADDFVVPAFRVWTPTQVSAFGVPVPGYADPLTFNVTIYNSSVVSVFSQSNIPFTKVADRYDIPLTGVPDLAAGQYFIAVQGNGNATGTLRAWMWGSNLTQTGAPAYYRNPGGARAPLCMSWTPRQSCQFVYGGSVVAGADQLFILNGIDQPNDPPVNSVPGPQTVNDAPTNLVFSAANGNAITVSDPDVAAGPSGLLGMSLSVTKGILTLGGTVGLVAVTGNGTSGTVTFFGTPANINTALNGLQYDPTNGYGGPDTLTVVSADFAQTGTGPAGGLSDTDTVAITVRARTALNIMPPNTIQFGGANANLNACLSTVDAIQPGTDLSGQTIVFKVDGTTIATDTTDPSGCANVTGTVGNPNLPAGTYFNRLTAEFAGSTYLLPSSDTTSTLTIGRRILFVKPVDRYVVLRQPNPPTDPHLDPACSAPNWCLELTNSTTFAPGDDFGDLNLANLRFQYARNPPSTNKTEFVGKTYRITAFGVSSANYDIRYQPGTMEVIAAP